MALDQESKPKFYFLFSSLQTFDLANHLMLSEPQFSHVFNRSTCLPTYNLYGSDETIG